MLCKSLSQIRIVLKMTFEIIENPKLKKKIASHFTFIFSEFFFLLNVTNENVRIPTFSLESCHM